MENVRTTAATLLSFVVALCVVWPGQGCADTIGDWERVRPGELHLIKHDILKSWSFQREGYSILEWEGQRIVLIPGTVPDKDSLLIRRHPSWDWRLKEIPEASVLPVFEYIRIPLPEDPDETMATVIIRELQWIEEAKDRDFLRQGLNHGKAPVWERLRGIFPAQSRLRNLTEPVDIVGIPVQLGDYDDWPRVSKETFARFRKGFEKHSKEWHPYFPHTDEP